MDDVDKDGGAGEEVYPYAVVAKEGIRWKG